MGFNLNTTGGAGLKVAGGQRIDSDEAPVMVTLKLPVMEFLEASTTSGLSVSIATWLQNLGS